MADGRPIMLLLYPVKDVAASKAIYSEYLGVEPYVDDAYYVGLRVGDQEIGLVPSAVGQETPIAYIDVSDIRASLKDLVEAGAHIHEDVHEVGGGLQIATVQDPDGNVLGLRQSS